MPDWAFWLFVVAAIVVLLPVLFALVVWASVALYYIAIGIGLAGKWLMNKVWRMEE